MLALNPIHVLTGIELLLGVAVTGVLLDSAGVGGVVLSAAAQTALFATAWLVLAALFVRTRPGSRDDLRLLLDLMADGLAKIRRIVLRSIA
jgi:hypothetical protein